MVKLTINNKEIHVEEGTSVLDAAQKAGFHIPAMCYHPGTEHFTSCMVCLVRDNSSGNLIPSCSVKVVENMDITTDDDEIYEARKTALELLLSEHVGDCEAPCRIACPANMNIPLMNRLLAEGKTNEALAVIRKDIAFPAVLGRICPAPCEGACKRKPVDQAVSICLLKRFAADCSNADFKPVLHPSIGKKVAITGSGPAGLSAAYYLKTRGIDCVVFDRNKQPGGALRYAVADEQLDKIVLNNEIEIIKKTGIEIRQEVTVDNLHFHNLVNEYDAVVIATGDFTDEVAGWGISHNKKQLLVNKSTYQTNLPKVFAAGNVNRSSKYAVRSVGQGKEAAFAIARFLSGKPVIGEPKEFNSRFGRLLEAEFGEYLKEAVNNQRVKPTGGQKTGFNAEEGKTEATRCLHCDCRKADNCKLRDYSTEYNASRKHFAGTSRKKARKYMHHSVVYEPHKCIKCGICVRLTEKYGEQLGFTFIGRGFDVEIGIPFNESIERALSKTAEKVAKYCPTGALSLK